MSETDIYAGREGTHADPILRGVTEHRDVIEMTAHVERDRGAGGTGEDAHEGDCLRDDFFRDACDRQHGNRHPDIASGGQRSGDHS